MAQMAQAELMCGCLSTEKSVEIEMHLGGHGEGLIHGW